MRQADLSIFPQFYKYTLSVFTFEVITQRLKDALRLKSDKELAAALGLKPNTFYNRKNARSLPFENILKLAQARNLHVDWLFFGVGRPFRNRRDLAVRTVAELDTKLMQEICFELEAAFTGLAPRDDKSKILFHAARRGGLAAFIYPKVAYIEDANLRRYKIRSDAKMLASASRLTEKAGEIVEASAEPRRANDDTPAIRGKGSTPAKARRR